MPCLKQRRPGAIDCRLAVKLDLTGRGLLSTNNSVNLIQNGPKEPPNYIIFLLLLGLYSQPMGYKDAQQRETASQQPAHQR